MNACFMKHNVTMSSKIITCYLFEANNRTPYLSHTSQEHYHFIQCAMCSTSIYYRVVDKSLARPGRKQANVSVRMALISFGPSPCRGEGGNLMTARVSMLLKSRASLKCFRACFFPGRANDLSAPPCVCV